MAPQDSQNCGRDFAKRKQTDAEFAGNSLLRMAIIDIVSNTNVGGLTLDPAGMHCGTTLLFLVKFEFTSVPVVKGKNFDEDGYGWGRFLSPCSCLARMLSDVAAAAAVLV